ncbi:MAG: nucleotidyltransferase domain-containing protein [Ruminococcus sp.]|nr:nucleotidyltransferase domain-containing protein [Ruminococcus sp.]
MDGGISMEVIEREIRRLLKKYHGEYALLFGSYARGEADEKSDIDVMVVGGENFELTDILDFGEELRIATDKEVDAFEIREIVKDSEFYGNILREGVRIA